MSLTPGVRLGAYEILGLIGAGGMGEVYKARDTRLDRTVAIKVLPEALAANPDRRARFEREARAVAALNHSHICTLHDVGESPSSGSTASSPESIRFLVMEYLEGQTLADRLLKGPLPPVELLRYAVELADALDHAHRQGLVHRDLKPGNVMLTRSGAKLLDFGLSRLQSSPDLLSLSTIASGDVPLTAEGTVLGTFPYMAPEQLAGHDADARSDIFAFGALVYEMATGRRAFDGTTAATLIGAILHTDPPPVSSLQPLAPAALDRIVARCLAKDPDDRWQSARDLMLELTWIADHAEPVEVEGAHRINRTLGLMAVAISVLAIAAAVFTVTYVRRAPADDATVRLSVSLPDGLTLGDFGIGGLSTISPDGRRLVFVAAGSNGRQLLWIRPIDSLEAQVLPGTDSAEDPFWSPDGQFIGFFAQRKLRKIHVSGGPIQALCDAVQPRGGAWNRNGVILFSANSGHQLYRISAGGGVAVPIPADGLNEERYWPIFLPDGRHFIYRGRPQHHGIYVAALDSSGAQLLLDGYLSAAYSPGYLLGLMGSSPGVSSGTLLAQPFDASQLKTTGVPFPIAEHVAYRVGMARAAFSVSENGTLVYGNVESLAAQLVWFDRSGKPLRNVGGSVTYNSPSLSPDEKTIAAERFDPDAQSEDIWLIDSAREVSSRFTSYPNSDTAPLWSPDGSRIVFASPRGTPPNLYQKTVNGPGNEDLLVKSIFNKYPSDWSRDGQYIAYSSLDPSTQWDLWLLPMSGTHADPKPVPFLRTPFNEVLGQFSPDGRWLAYVSDESGNNEVYVRTFPAAGAPQRISADGGGAPRWRRDGRELFYLAGDGTLMAVSVKLGAGFETSRPVSLFKTRIPGLGTSNNWGYNPNYIVARDGQRFLINTVTEEHSVPTTIVLNWPAAFRNPPAR